MPAGRLSLELRVAGEADLPAIRRLRETPDVSAVSRRGSSLDGAAYERELAAALDDPAADVLVVELGGERAGYVRIDQRTDGEYEIGIAIEEAARGRGVGTQAIEAATRRFRAQHPHETLIALVRPANAASARAFGAAGYRLRGRDGEFDVYVAEPPE